MNNSRRTKKTLTVAGVTLAATLALAGCASGSSNDGAAASTQESGDGAHLTRAQLYSDIDELASDSVAIAVGTVTAQRVATDIDDATAFTISSFEVTESVKSDGFTDVGRTVDVRQVGSPEGSAPTDLLAPGNTYLLYLTASGLDGELSSQYYVTGASAGLYAQATSEQSRSGTDEPSSRFVQVDATDGENLPAEVNVDELR
jgi:hypothetical protein